MKKMKVMKAVKEMTVMKAMKEMKVMKAVKEMKVMKAVKEMTVMKAVKKVREVIRSDEDSRGSPITPSSNGDKNIDRVDSQITHSLFFLFFLLQTAYIDWYYSL